MAYLVGFPGMRDSYQLPIALAEASELDLFVSDFYLKDPSSFPALAHLHASEIPNQLIRAHPWFRFFAKGWMKLPFDREVMWNIADSMFSKLLIKHLKRARSDIFTYEPYAWEAFRAHYTHNPRKLLFYFHPHIEIERTLFTADSKQYPEFSFKPRAQPQTSLQKWAWKRRADAWKLADHVFCASTFSKKTLLEAGLEESKCSVVPYGTNFSEIKIPNKRSSPFRALFVGSDAQRKGLHHLLLAWKDAKLENGSELRVIFRSSEPKLESLAAEIPSVRLQKGVPREGLLQAYADSDLFIMPSLVEGFGHVYLEALAQGCPVLGTENTSLPDLGTEVEGIFLTEVSNIERLRERIEELSAKLPDHHTLRAKAQENAHSFTWESFRERLRASL